MYKIYFNHKTIYVTTSRDEVPELKSRNDVMYIEDDVNANSVETVLLGLQKPNLYAVVFIVGDLEVSLKNFKESVGEVIEAGGGLVQSQHNNILFINRRGKWDLPKGKKDEGEDIQACAIREVREETGLSKVSISNHLLTTYHIYRMQHKYVLKESHWFKMNATEEPLTPQTDEDIEQCIWVNPGEMETCLSNTYPLIKDVIDQEFGGK